MQDFPVRKWAYHSLLNSKKKSVVEEVQREIRQQLSGLAVTPKIYDANLPGNIRQHTEQWHKCCGDYQLFCDWTWILLHKRKFTSGIQIQSEHLANKTLVLLINFLTCHGTKLPSKDLFSYHK